MRRSATSGAWLALALALHAPAPARAQGAAYLDPSRPTDERVDDLLSQLSLDEKAELMGTTAPTIERLHIPAMWGWNQSLHGVVWNEPTTMFPVNIGMAATFDPPLIHDVASTIGDEARAVYNLVRTTPGTPFTGGRRQGGANGSIVTRDGRRLQLNGLVYRSPVINLSRQPLWGRVIETFGEDPYLTSRMAVAYVKGMQGDDSKYLKTVATLKHYAAYQQEDGRHTNNAIVPERWLHEYYLEPFRAGIVEGGARSIMSVYNEINGTPGAANTLLMTDMLVNHWGFKGFRVPDSGAIEAMVRFQHFVQTNEEAAATALKAGHDLDEGGIFPHFITGAVQDGLATETQVDDALRRVLRARFELGEFDSPDLVPYSKISPDAIDSPAHRQLALRTARESIVLLKNRGGLLPLDRSAVHTLAVIGPEADTAMAGIGYTGHANDFVVPLQGIRNKVEPGTQVLYARGSDIMGSDTSPEPGYAEAAAVAARADVAVVVVGTSSRIEREGHDRTSVRLDPVQVGLVQRVLAANPKTIVVMVNGGPLSLVGTGDGPNVPAQLMMFMAGEEGGNALGEVLFGDTNPGGKLPYTVYHSADDVPSFDDYDISDGFTYMYFEGQPEWPFGHGLSYTTFSYSNLEVSSDSLAGNGRIRVSVDVRNTGSGAGDEVAQLYFHDLRPAVKRAREQLEGFQRVSLKPGESRRVTFTLSARQLAY